MALLRVEPIILTLTGASGSTQSDIPFNGYLHAVHIAYANIAAATTDVTVKCLDPDLTLLTVADSNTSAWYFPRVLLDDTAGADLTAVYDKLPVWGLIEVSAAQSDAGTITVTLIIERV